MMIYCQFYALLKCTKMSHFNSDRPFDQSSVLISMKYFMCTPSVVLLLHVLSQQSQAQETHTRVFKKGKVKIKNQFYLFLFSVLCSRGIPTSRAISIREKDSVIFMAIKGVRGCFANFKVGKTTKNKLG